MPNDRIITERLGSSARDIAQAVDLLRKGELVAFPTETVYGLGADATNATAVARIFQAKGRPQFNPLIVHFTDAAAAEAHVEMPEEALRLASTFWPGALTLVLPLKPSSPICSLVTAGLGTVGVRVPDHPVAEKLLRGFAGAIAAPSANVSGRVSPTTANHVLDGLDGKISAVVDAGACPVGVESTIIGFDEGAMLLRPGGIPVEAIEECLGHPLKMPRNTPNPTAPGQLESHYATEASIRLNAKERQPDELMLGFGPVDCDLNLSRSANLVEAAANLFDFLRKLDELGTDRIAVSPIPDHGLGRAINDRLRRAAAPRPAPQPKTD